jgi:hypothetical protein
LNAIGLAPKTAGMAKKRKPTRPVRWGIHKLAAKPTHRNELVHSRLDEIAKAIRTLTYGEMLELAEAMWKVTSRGSEITESDLPGRRHLLMGDGDGTTTIVGHGRWGWDDNDKFRVF